MTNEGREAIKDSGIAMEIMRKMTHTPINAMVLVAADRPNLSNQSGEYEVDLSLLGRRGKSSSSVMD